MIFLLVVLQETSHAKHRVWFQFIAGRSKDDSNLQLSVQSCKDTGTTNKVSVQYSISVSISSTLQQVNRAHVCSCCCCLDWI